MQILLQQVDFAFLPKDGQSCGSAGHRWSQPYGTIYLAIPAVSPEQVVRCHTKMRTSVSARSLVPALLHFYEPPFTATPGCCRPSRDRELWK